MRHKLSAFLLLLFLFMSSVVYAQKESPKTIIGFGYSLNYVHPHLENVTGAYSSILTLPIFGVMFNQKVTIGIKPEIQIPPKQIRQFGNMGVLGFLSPYFQYNFFNKTISPLVGFSTRFGKRIGVKPLNFIQNGSEIRRKETSIGILASSGVNVKLNSRNNISLSIFLNKEYGNVDQIIEGPPSKTMNEKYDAVNTGLNVSYYLSL